MSLTLNEFYDGKEPLPTAHKLLLHYPEAAYCGAEELGGRLQLFTGRRLQINHVQIVLEELQLGSGEVAP